MVKSASFAMKKSSARALGRTPTYTVWTRLKMETLQILNSYRNTPWSWNYHIGSRNAIEMAYTRCTYSNSAKQLHCCKSTGTVILFYPFTGQSWLARKSCSQLLTDLLGANSSMRCPKEVIFHLLPSNFQIGIMSI